MAVEVKPRESSDVETEQLATGCEAIAEAIRLADVDVMAAYPIRPYDGVMQAAAKLIAAGKMNVEYIVADGVHSQFEIVKHACAVGSRVFGGSSGGGWVYAFEAISATACCTPTTRSPSRRRSTRTGSWRSACRTTRPCGRHRTSSARRTRTSRG